MHNYKVAIYLFFILQFPAAGHLAAQSDAANRALNWLRSQMQFDIDPGPGTARLDTRIPVGTNAWAIIAIAQYELLTGDETYREMIVPPWPKL